MTADRNPLVHEAVDEAVQQLHALPPPRATYRLQFNHAFTFNDAQRVVPYLASLGISHVYASPVFRATPGSPHGYDVVDFGEINPEIGTKEEFDEFVSALHGHGLRLIVDFVPNHMGIEGGHNAWWQDVLEHGEESRFADHFDIEWAPIKRELHGKVLLPFLGDQYGDVLERGELTLVFADGAFRIDYWRIPFPVSPATYPIVLRSIEARLVETVAIDDLDLLEVQSIRTALEHLGSIAGSAPGEDGRDARQREQVLAKHRLAALATTSPAVRQAIDDTVADFNGTPGRPSSFDALDDLLDAQPYRLAFWRVAAEEINYRRFFAINALAAIRQESTKVLRDTHALLFRLIAEGKVDGVRIDHPDGLWDPARYFRDLQRAAVTAIARRELGDESRDDVDPMEAARLERDLDQAVDCALDRYVADHGRWPLYVVAEKILEHGETLRDDWAVSGTVGYEFAQATTGVFVDAEARVLIDRVYSRFTGERVRFPELVYSMKQRMMREAFASEVNVLANVLNRISEQDRHSRDFTLNNLRDSLREILACFPVYRTYSTCDRDSADDRDARYVRAAVVQARRLNPAMDATVFAFIEAALLHHVSADGDGRRDSRCHFAMKFQQLSGPIMAKGLEDTAFYRFNRLMSLNEVGGDPSRFGTSVEEFHRQNRARLRTRPDGMLASSTHDTKRSEDVRARMTVLSEVPTEWRAALNRWSRLNRKLKVTIEGALAPQRIDEYVIYQTVVATWPLGTMSAATRDAYVARLQAYIVKVGSEANRVTNWINPDEVYETAITDFVAGLFNHRRSRAFLDDLAAFCDRVTPAGLTNALAQQVLKLTSPGVPDIYQGTEIWDDSLVDPDNRRPVDFEARVQALDRLDASTIPDLAADSVGLTKLAVTARILALRAAEPALFARGDYVPLTAEGPAADHLIAYARQRDGQTVIVIVPRLVANLAAHCDGDPWRDTVVRLPPDVAGQALRDVFREREVDVPADEDSPRLNASTLFGSCPVAVLLATSTDHATTGGGTAS